MSKKRCEQAVLKLESPGSSDILKESKVLLLATRPGYAKIYAVDEATKTMMMERLSAPLASFSFSSTEEIGIIGGTLRVDAVSMRQNPGLTTGTEKAQRLSDFIEEMTTTSPKGSNGDTIAQARDYIVQHVAA
ncbi:MAG: hypothetical protein CMP98_06595 [Gammaproteobacteria bacterium]|nr:hypothetical protein [Gammaproteobacteria bacterium]OUU09752.1 MAG: hypothetical protein CBB94_06755 [Gammaproteobacteria bacterium TMED34]